MSFGKTANKQETVEKKKGSPPMYTERAGLVKADVWENTSSEGKTFKTVSVQRSYKDKEDKWQTTTSFRVNDLPRLQLVLAKVYEKAVLSEQDGD